MRLPQPTDHDATWLDWVAVHRALTRQPVGRPLTYAELTTVYEHLTSRGQRDRIGLYCALNRQQLERFEAQRVRTTVSDQRTGKVS